jgi:hypothetical protein
VRGNMYTACVADASVVVLFLSATSNFKLQEDPPGIPPVPGLPPRWMEFDLVGEARDGHPIYVYSIKGPSDATSPTRPRGRMAPPPHDAAIVGVTDDSARRARKAGRTPRRSADGHDYRDAARRGRRHRTRDTRRHPVGRPRRPRGARGARGGVFDTRRATYSRSA